MAGFRAMSDTRFRPISDHLGNVFRSRKCLTDFWGIDYGTFCKYISYYGFSVKDSVERCLANAKAAEESQKLGFLAPSRVPARLASWGVSSSDAARIMPLIRLPAGKIGKNRGRAHLVSKFEQAHICPRTDDTSAAARWDFGFTLRECALSSRAFARLVLERFHV